MQRLVQSFDLCRNPVGLLGTAAVKLNCYRTLIESWKAQKTPKKGASGHETVSLKMLRLTENCP